MTSEEIAELEKSSHLILIKYHNQYVLSTKSDRAKIINIDLSKEVTVTKCAQLCEVLPKTVKNWIKGDKVISRKVIELNNIDLISISSLPANRCIYNKSFESKVLNISLFQYMDVKDFANFIEKSQRLVKRWIKEGKLSCKIIPELDDLILVDIDNYTYEFSFNDGPLTEAQKAKGQTKPPTFQLPGL